MNIGSSLTPLSAPSAPPEPSAEERRTASARHPEDAFDRLMKAELDKKRAEADAQHLLPLPLPQMPWQLLPQNPHEDGEEDLTIEATQGIEATAARAGRQALPLVPLAPVARREAPALPDSVELDVAPVAAPIARPEEAPAQPVAFIVEAGLPPVQPLSQPSDEPVRVADFPQVVMGQVKQMVKDDVPITQLDVQITPPHMGPVNLNVQLQEGVVAVQVIVPTIQAKQAMEGQVHSIASILQASNLTAGPIRIVTAASGKAGAGNAGQSGEQAGFGLLNGGRRKPSGPDDMTSGSV